MSSKRVKKKLPIAQRRWNMLKEVLKAGFVVRRISDGPNKGVYRFDGYVGGKERFVASLWLDVGCKEVLDIKKRVERGERVPDQPGRWVEQGDEFDY